MSVLDLIFPKACIGCGKEGTYICSNCVTKVRLAKPICPYCEKSSIDGVTHARCLRKFGLDGLVSVWEYEGVIRRAVLALKYRYSTEVGKELSDLFVSAMKSQNTKYLIPDTGLVVPIPLYWYRQNARGFNQAIEIGKAVAAQMGWKFVSDLLVKKRSTFSQVELKGDERRQNLKDVFAINLDSNLELPDSILLFDDVFTTGSTLKEATKVLKRAGAKKAWGLTIAR